eukprot:scaffold394704_cov35-Attheya_sp.AAC.1
MRPFNGTVVTMLPNKERYIVHWDPPDGKSEKVTSYAVLKRWSLTKNKEVNDSTSEDDSDDSSTLSKSNHIIASSSGDDRDKSDNGGVIENR